MPSSTEMTIEWALLREKEAGDILPGNSNLKFNMC